MVWQSPKGKLLYRVGDVLISTNSQNPSEWFGGTWELLCPGKTLVCINTGDADFNTIKKTGGSKSVTLTTSQIPSHNHGASSSSAGWHGHTGSAGGGDHRHRLPYKGNAGSDISGSGCVYPQVAPYGQETHLDVQETGNHSHTLSIDGNGSHTHTISVGATGGSGSHTNLQPFMVVYMWVRTA